MDTPAASDGIRSEVDELRTSRAQVVGEADAERRRIERNLHDGVQQHLVALAVNLQLARQLVDSDPPASLTLLDDVADGVREALESVRSLAQTIYPTLLLDRGLADALQAAVAAVGGGVRLEVDVGERYPVEVEAAAYFVCVESIGVARTIRVWATDGFLQFEITGDGVIPPAASTVAGRLDALGAELVIAPERVSGRIQIAR
jgi:signal transduction histidine kinase